VNVETKDQAKQRMHTHSPNKPKMFELTLSARKLMAAVFWDREVCCKTLTKCVGPAIQNRRCGMLTSGVVLLHDNVHTHTVAHTGELLEYFNWELFDHFPCCPNLASSMYYLFTYLKNWLRSQHFNNNELMEAVKHG
jgi:hypothetical protein